MPTVKRNSLKHASRILEGKIEGKTYPDVQICALEPQNCPWDIHNCPKRDLGIQELDEILHQLALHNLGTLNQVLIPWRHLQCT